MKKNLAKISYVLTEFKSDKIFRIMRLSVFFPFVFILQLYAVSTHSQSAVVEINLNSLTISELIEEIEAQTDYLFIFSKNDIDANQYVKVSTNSNQVGEILKEAFSDTDITYVFANNYISLRKKTQTEKGVIPSFPVLPQAKRITGKVIDEMGDPIIGANVVEKGTTNGTITNADGDYMLEIPNNAILHFSYIGYLPQEVPAAGRNFVNVTLVEDVKSIEEVVVVGYGIQRKVTTTGSVGKVEGDELAKMSTVNTSKALQGLTPGITVIDRGGAPGSDDPDIFLRGVGTTGSSSPLILVDGIEMGLSQVPSQDIESISILKDAASASIYGSRAAHGVILVTTKRGKAGKMKLSYSGYIGIQDLAIRPNQVSAREYMDMVNEASLNAGNSPLYSEEVIMNTVNKTDPFKYPYNNFIDKVFQSTYITQHTVNIAGGNESGRYLMSFDYLDQPGLTKNTEYQRYNYRMNADLNVGKILRVSSDLTYRHTDRLWPEKLGDAQYRAFSMRPTTPVRHENGNYALDDQQTNPVAYMDLDVVGRSDYQTDNMIGQVKANWNL